MFLISLCTILTLAVLFFGKKEKKILLSSGVDKGEEYKIIAGKNMLIAFVVILVFTSTVRYGFVDTYAYKIMYTSSKGNLNYVNSEPWGVEKGWLYFLYLLNYISESPKLMLFIVAMVVNIAYVKMASKYSVDVPLSLVIYFCLNYMDTNNGVRQCFSAGILLLAFPLLVEKRYIIYSLFVFLASIFHESAIVVLLFALASVGKPFNWKVILTLMAGVIFLFMPETVSGFLGEVTLDHKYNMYFDKQNGMSLMRCFIIGIFPLILGFIYYAKHISTKKQISKIDSILLNLLIINSVLYLMGLYMQYWARLAFYTSFAPILLMPKLINEVFDKRYIKTIKIVAMICYFIFFAYNIYVNIGYGAMDDFYMDIFKG